MKAPRSLAGIEIRIFLLDSLKHKYVREKECSKYYADVNFKDKNKVGFTTNFGELPEVLGEVRSRIFWLIRNERHDSKS